MSKTTSPYTIESKIAVPQPHLRGVWKPAKKASKKTTVDTSFPIESMKKGDSFLIPATNRAQLIHASRRASSAAIKHVEATGFKKEFVTRFVEGGLRVFRVK